MPFMDSILWVAILVGGLVLSLWYGASWRAWAKALAEPGQRPTVAPMVVRAQTPPVQMEQSETSV